MLLQILISVCMALGIKNKCCVLSKVNFYFLGDYHECINELY